MTEARPGAAASASLWERDAELTVITEAVDALCDDASPSEPGSLLVFSGEAGIGKTALLAETRRIAEERGCAVWWARGGETVTSVPFNVVRQLLQPVLLSLMPLEAREYLGDWYEVAGPALGIADPGERQADPQGVCDGLVEVVSRLARREWPLVLIVDDAHWADQETLHWLAACCERLADLRVLLVVALRPGEASGEGARHLDAITAAARRPVGTLSALTPEATAGLTRATVGAHADAPFCREVWAVTGGNPYETVELLAKVQDSQLDPVEASCAELRDLNRSARGNGLVARLEGLGIDATRFAWAAAILGTGITLDLVAELATMRPEEAARCAELLVAARILTAPDVAGRRTDGAELEFVHPLIASAVYRSIPDGLRTAARHRRAGRHRLRARRGGRLPPPPRSPPGRRRGTGRADAGGSARTPRRRRPRSGPPLSGARPGRTADARGPPVRALRTGLRHAADLTGHHHRLPPGRPGPAGPGR